MADIVESARPAGSLIDHFRQRVIRLGVAAAAAPTGDGRCLGVAIHDRMRDQVADITGTRHVTLWSCLKRGFRRRCPRCGGASMFTGYLTIAAHCTGCGLEFDAIRADDAPAYFTISVVGHIVVSGLLLMEATLHPPSWLQAAIWLPATLFLSLALLPFMKGGVMAAIYCSRRKHHGT